LQRGFTLQNPDNTKRSTHRSRDDQRVNLRKHAFPREDKACTAQAEEVANIGDQDETRPFC
jgi:hypothetical protein